MDKLKQAVDSVKVSVGVKEESDTKSFLHSVDEAATLSWKQRIIGFACCMGLGLVLSIVSMPMLWTLKLAQFAIFYSIGSVLSIMSTVFLMGPVKQVKRMLDSGRWIATLVYFVSIVVTLVVAFKSHNAGLCLICLIVQTIALSWYCITWIPGGQQFVKGLIFRG